jgi:hypothetical protein
MSAKKKQTPKKLRRVLVILSNRLNRLQKPRFLEIECDESGGIHSETPLRSEPREARFDEVWENDQGKTDFASCHRFSRKYGHKLQKR